MKKMITRLIISAVFLIAIPLAHIEGPFLTLLYAVPYLIAGYDILIEAFHGIMEREPFDECFLMAVATIGAFALGSYSEGVVVMVLYQAGELFQDVAVDKSRDSITDLMDIRPDTALLECADGSLKEVDPNTVSVGDIIVVNPGDRVPIDGIVVDGESLFDTSALTGESLPRPVAAGDEVQSGCVSLNGRIKIKTTRPFGESTASKILELVESAGSRKSRSEKFITKFARIYTPIVCFAALALAVIPPVIISLTSGASPVFGDWIYRALTFLVISCPCALVISIPLTFFAGIGGAGREGVLIKGSNYLETLSRISTVVFDKTGTLTEGKFTVSDIIPEKIEKQELLHIAAIAECSSNHPIARSIIQACGTEPDKSAILSCEEHSGRGVTVVALSSALHAGNENVQSAFDPTADAAASTLLAGSARLLKEQGIDFDPYTGDRGSAIYVACDNIYLGCIIVSDAPRPTSASAIAGLRKLGIKKTVMLTGDREMPARNTAAALGLDEVRFELLPSDKVDEVEKLLSSSDSKERLCFVGDGINDAPVLARADIGVAMGALGSDAAIEAADVVLMNDDPEKLVSAIKISRKPMRIVYENIAFAIGIKLICLVLGALGIAGMWLAIFADVGVMVLAVINAMRALGKVK